VSSALAARALGAALGLVLLVGVWAAAGRAALPARAFSGETAPVRTTASTRAPDPAAQRAALRRAMALLGYRGRLGYRIVLAPPRPAVRAETNTGTRTITVFLDPMDAPHKVAHDIAHELGHAWDARHLDDAGRRAYLERRGADHAAWWPRTVGADYATGAGDFAEVFARCHAASPEFRSRLAPPPADACAALPPGARDAW
jgi:hypothetical protein